MASKEKYLLGTRLTLKPTLIDSSITTLNWLKRIKNEVIKKIPTILYRESKYYALFKSHPKNRNIAALHLQKTQIRFFLKLPVYYDKDLELTISSGTWAEYYPSIFKLRTVNTIEKAIELILKSYEYDLGL